MGGRRLGLFARPGLGDRPLHDAHLVRSALQAWRADVARQAAVRPTVVLSDKALEAIVRSRPTTIDELAEKASFLEVAYLLIDGSKFGVRAVEFFGAVRELDHIITDPHVPPAMVEKLRALSVQVEIAE